MYFSFMEKGQIIASYKHNSNYCCKWETGVIVELHLASKLEPEGVKYFCGAILTSGGHCEVLHI